MLLGHKYTQLHVGPRGRLAGGDGCISHLLLGLPQLNQPRCCIYALFNKGNNVNPEEVEMLRIARYPCCSQHGVLAAASLSCS